ncbi:MAG: hypothetical protein AB1758_24835 [Candidatus Eremiobacterota bacterium]
MNERLQKLKDELISATDFGEVFGHFFDLCEQDPHFMEAGDLVRDPLLEEALRVAARKIGPPEAAVEGLLMIGLPEHGFVHGRFTHNRRMGGFFYFHEVHMGLASVVDASGKVDLVRFTTMQGPSLN